MIISLDTKVMKLWSLRLATWGLCGGVPVLDNLYLKKTKI